MTLPTEEIYNRALMMAKDVEDNFLDLGRQLRQLQIRDPDLFHKIMETSDLGRRKAYYLVEISKAFDPLPISRVRLRKLGWTKCQLIGKYVTKDNVQELVTLAESLPAKQLERKMRGETPVKNAHCVLMYFSPKEYEDLETVLVTHGAYRAPKGQRGIQGKEDALMKAIRSVMPKRA